MKHKTLLPSPTRQKILQSEKLWMLDGKPSLRTLQLHLLEEGRLDLNDLKRICILAAGLFEEEPNLLRLRSPVNVMGDIHGQFYDLTNIMMKVVDSPAESPMLFLGDYVDRGYFGLETVLYLFALKIHYPDSVFLLRGNHETRAMTNAFNFKEEVVYKYKSEHIYSIIMKTFDKLPIAAVIDNSWFCCHGGLSKDLVKLEDLETVNRFKEPSEKGMLCDIIWADYYRKTNVEDADLNEPSVEPVWKDNMVRGCSSMYNKAALNKFLSDNKLKGVIRAHEVCKEGFNVDFFEEGADRRPKHVTIFSAPNYCDVYKNKGAYLRVSSKDCICKTVEENTHCDLGEAYHSIGFTFVTFDAVSHPYYLPKFQTALELSFPFIADKLASAATVISKKAEDIKNLEETKKYLENKKREEMKALYTGGLCQRDKENFVNQHLKTITDKELESFENIPFDEIKKMDSANEIFNEEELKKSCDISETSSIDSVSKSVEYK